MKKLPILVIGFLFFATASLHSIKAQEEEASFIPVNELKIGDWVFVKGDEENLVPEKITKHEWVEGPIEVYNLTVEGDETYFANSFAVHNKGEHADPQCGVEIQPTVGSMIWSWGEIANGSDGEWATKLPSFPVTPGRIYEVKAQTSDWRNLEKREPYPPWPFACSTPWLRVDTDRGIKPALLMDSVGKITTFTYVATKNQMEITIGFQWTRGKEDPPECGWWRPSGTTIDWIQVREISGAGSAASQNVSFRLGIWAESGMGARKIQNPDESWPDWSWFHWEDTGQTLSAPLSSGKINVQVMDYDDQTGFCSDTVSLGPVGWLDAATCDYFPGWAGDKDVPNQAINVRFYANGPANSGTFLGSTTANRWREKAVCDAVGGNCGVCTNNPLTTPPITSAPQCYHGFSFTTPSSLKDGQNHTIYAYGINAPGTPGSDAQLSGVPKTINCPVGTITGKVYQNLEGQCSGTETPSDSGWTVTCAGVPTRKDSSTQFTCLNAQGSDQLAYGTYVIDLTSPTGWQVITGAGCQQDPTSIQLDSPSETVTPPFYIWQGQKAWFQTEGGDSHAQGNIRSYIPIGKYFCKDASYTNGYPGVVSYGNDYDFSAGSGQGEDRASSKGWLANSSYTPDYNYNYFYRKLDSPSVDNFKDSNGRRYCDDVACPTPTGTTIYYVDGDLNIQRNSDWAVPNNSKIVVLINGNLNINFPAANRKITIAQGGFLGLIAKGNINISGNIGDKLASTTPHLEGVYLADGIIDTYDPDPVGEGSGFRLVGAGLFYAKGGFALERDLKDDCTGICNETTPAELFIFRPDLVLNAPQELWVSKMSWLEVAP